jgi:hypothetical protein
MYIRIPVETEQMPGVDSSRVVEKMLEISNATGGVDPFIQCAVWQITIIVYSGGPPRNNHETGITIDLNIGNERPPGISLPRY